MRHPSLQVSGLIFLSLLGTWIGTDQKRRFVMDGDRLTISESYELDGREVKGERILLRDNADPVE